LKQRENDIKEVNVMSMRGELISQEYQRMVWVKDDDGKEFAYYADDFSSPDHVSEQDKEKDLDTSMIMGGSW
jgi:hypothetical protein